VIYLERAVPILAGVVGLIVVGLLDAIVQLRNLSARMRFAVEFQNRWVRYFETLGPGQPATADYTWLAGHQTRMTAELGPADRIDYRAPFGQYIMSNYPALTNTLAASRSGRGAEPDMVAFVDHLLISWGGTLHDGQERLARELRNPVYLLGRGLRFVVSLPLLLMYWSGLLPRGVESARSSRLFRLIQFLVAIVVAVAAVMTVVLGWSAFVAQLKAWFPWLP
jgi:hypothetical protein